MTSTTAHDTTFSTDATALDGWIPSHQADLGDNNTFDLRITAAAKTMGDAVLHMQSYNGSIAGPTLSAAQTGDHGRRAQRRRHADILLDPPTQARGRPTVISPNPARAA